MRGCTWVPAYRGSLRALHALRGDGRLIQELAEHAGRDEGLRRLDVRRKKPVGRIVRDLAAQARDDALESGGALQRAMKFNSLHGSQKFNGNDGSRVLRHVSQTP